jgi:hypothetical protein
MGQEEKAAAAGQSYEQDQGRKSAGYSPAYRALAPVAESVGVNVPGMEEDAKAGNERGVLGHALAPAATLAAGEALGHGAPAVGEALQEGTPKAVATAPLRLAARSAEGIVNSSPLRYVRSAGKLFTPADQARKQIRIPGRDVGLDLPTYPRITQPERPSPAVMQARGLGTGGYAPAEPSSALARIPATGAQPDTSLAVRPQGRIGGRLVLTPEEIAQAEQTQKIATKRARERGMQYAGGMRPSGGKIQAP